MRPMFEAAGFPIPRNVRLTCGFPHTKSFAAKNRRLGECWGEANSGDGHFEIMVSPVLEDPMRVAGVLAHELVHASVGLECEHKGNFPKLATAIGLEGKMSATTEGAAFKRDLAPILDAVGRGEMTINAALGQIKEEQPQTRPTPALNLAVARGGGSEQCANLPHHGRTET
jgi:hypothetical protein